MEGCCLSSKNDSCCGILIKIVLVASQRHHRNAILNTAISSFNKYVFSPDTAQRPYLTNMHQAVLESGQSDLPSINAYTDVLSLATED